MILSTSDKDLTLVGHVLYCVLALPSKLIGINTFDFNTSFCLKDFSKTIYIIDKQLILIYNMHILIQFKFVYFYHKIQNMEDHLKKLWTGHAMFLLNHWLLTSPSITGYSLLAGSRKYKRLFTRKLKKLEIKFAEGQKKLNNLKYKLPSYTKNQSR